MRRPRDFPLPLAKESLFLPERLCGALLPCVSLASPPGIGSDLFPNRGRSGPCVETPSPLNTERMGHIPFLQTQTAGSVPVPKRQLRPRRNRLGIGFHI